MIFHVFEQMAAKLNYIEFMCALTIIQAQKSGRDDVALIQKT